MLRNLWRNHSVSKLLVKSEKVIIEKLSVKFGSEAARIRLQSRLVFSFRSIYVLFLLQPPKTMNFLRSRPTGSRGTFYIFNGRRAQKQRVREYPPDSFEKPVILPVSFACLDDRWQHFLASRVVFVFCRSWFYSTFVRPWCVRSLRRRVSSWWYPAYLCLRLS